MGLGTSSRLSYGEALDAGPQGLISNAFLGWSTCIIVHKTVKLLSSDYRDIHDASVRHCTPCPKLSRYVVTMLMNLNSFRPTLQSSTVHYVSN